MADQPQAVVARYDDLLAAVRARVAELGINYQILDLVAGFTDGYSTKLLAHSEYGSNGGRRSKRHFSPESFDAYMEALGLELVVIENAAKTARLKAFCENKYLAREGPVRTVAWHGVINLKVSRNFMKQIGKTGGIASGRKRHAAAVLRAINRRKALQRWRGSQTVVQS